jgi:hypothetical protein
MLIMRTALLSSGQDTKLTLRSGDGGAGQTRRNWASIAVRATGAVGAPLGTSQMQTGQR